MIHNVSVAGQQPANGQQDQPQGSGLAEIFPEGAEEHAGQGVVLPPDNFQGGVVQRRGGRPNGNDGNAAEEPEDIQAAAVAQLHHQLAKGTVVGKKFHVAPSFTVSFVESRQISSVAV